MQHQEQQQQLALAISTSALVVLDVLCVASEDMGSTRGSSSATPSPRCATTAQLWNRWPDVRAMCPAPTSVARRPSLYREQSPGDRRPHGSAYNCYTTARVRRTPTERGAQHGSLRRSLHDPTDQHTRRECRPAAPRRPRCSWPARSEGANEAAKRVVVSRRLAP